MCLLGVSKQTSYIPLHFFVLWTLMFRVRLTITSITSCNNLLLMSDLLLNLPFFSLVVSKMEVGPTKPTAENDLILNFKGQNILLMNPPFFSLVVSKMELGPKKFG